ncbi:unnamed protein product, partial [Meganyctiphanes norvegica]
MQPMDQSWSRKSSCSYGTRCINWEAGEYDSEQITAKMTCSITAVSEPVVIEVILKIINTSVKAKKPTKSRMSSELFTDYFNEENVPTIKKNFPQQRVIVTMENATCHPPTLNDIDDLIDMSLRKNRFILSRPSPNLFGLLLIPATREQPTVDFDSQIQTNGRVLDNEVQGLVSLFNGLAHERDCEVSRENICTTIDKFIQDDLEIHDQLTYPPEDLLDELTLFENPHPHYEVEKKEALEPLNQLKELMKRQLNHEQSLNMENHQTLLMMQNHQTLMTSFATALPLLTNSVWTAVFRSTGMHLVIFLLKQLSKTNIFGKRRGAYSAVARAYTTPLRTAAQWGLTSLEMSVCNIPINLSYTRGNVLQNRPYASQEKELRAVTEGWVVEARGRLQQCHQLCGTLKDLVGRAHQYISVVNMQAAVVQHQLGQPTLASTIADTLALIGAQVESISSLTDPNVARGYSNPNTPRVQPTDTSYDSGFTNQPTLHTGANGPKYSNGNPPGPAHGPSGPKYNNGNPPPLHNRPHGPNYNNGHTPRRLHNGPGGSIYNSGGNSPLPSHIVHPSGHRHNNDNIIMNNNFPFSNSPGPYKPSNPHSHFHPHNPQRIINN